MKKIYYEKVGRKYVPVSEYDSDFIDSFDKGSHLIACYPGGQSRRYHIDPAYAPLIAASRVAEDAIASAMYKISEIRTHSNEPLTLRQKKAWDSMVKELGGAAFYAEYASAREIAEVGVKAMEEEAMRLLTNPAVKKAYDHFIMVCELTKEHENA